jgi:hypothetical protein
MGASRRGRGQSTHPPSVLKKNQLKKEEEIYRKLKVFFKKIFFCPE